MDLEQVSTIAGIINQIITSLAIIVAGIWAYWNFVVRRTGIWNLQIIVNPEVLPYKNNKRLLVIYVTLKNIGSVKITPGSKGCRVTVYRLEKNGREGKILDWEKGKIIMKEVDILKRYKGKRGYLGYEIEPNCEFDEIETLIVKRGDLLLIQADFWWLKNEDVVNDYKVVHVE